MAYRRKRKQTLVRRPVREAFEVDAERIRGRDIWSIRPGDPPPGEYIGYEDLEPGKIRNYYEDEEGVLWYRDYPEYGQIIDRRWA